MLSVPYFLLHGTVQLPAALTDEIDVITYDSRLARVCGRLCLRPPLRHSTSFLFTFCICSLVYQERFEYHYKLRHRLFHTVEELINRLPFRSNPILYSTLYIRYIKQIIQLQFLRTNDVYNIKYWKLTEMKEHLTNRINILKTYLPGHRIHVQRAALAQT